MGDTNWVLYAGGYKRAGDLLVEHGITHGEQHALVFPAVFLYRQYIELQLKEIIRSGYRLLDSSIHSPLGFPNHHKIDKLWRECRSILKKIDEEEYKKLGKDERCKYKECLDAVEQGINEFSEWDPDSTAFRYPVDKRGNPSISALNIISFRNLKELAGGISYLLDGISIGISECLNARREMNSSCK